MNNESVERAVNQVSTRKEAEAVVTKLLKEYSGDTALSVVETTAKERKKSTEEVTRQTVRNLFTTFSTNRYSK